MKKKTNTKSSNSSSSKMKFRPMGDRILIKPETVEEKTASGIIIPDTARKEKPETGIVVAVGPGKRGDDNEIIPVSVKVGDRVMFSKYGFDEVMLDEEEYYVVSESSILGIF